PGVDVGDPGGPPGRGVVVGHSGEEIDRGPTLDGIHEEAREARDRGPVGRWIEGLDDTAPGRREIVVHRPGPAKGSLRRRRRAATARPTREPASRPTAVD